MDASDFAIQLDLTNSGILTAIEDQLLQGEAQKSYIRAELYKLNIYGNARRDVSWYCPA